MESNDHVKRLDEFMRSRKDGDWILDGDYWKSDFGINYWTSYIDRRIDEDGGVMTGYEGDEVSCEKTKIHCIKYDSVEDMIAAEFGE